MACERCGQDLRLVSSAVRRRRGPPARARRRAVVGGGLLALVLVGALGWYTVQKQRAQQVVLQHYLNGIWAAEVGQWDRAVAEFGAAGSFRDAPARRQQAAAQLSQVQGRYEAALAEQAAGRPWDAALLLRQVMAVLPDHTEAARLLAANRRLLGPLVLVRQQPNVPPEDASTVVLASAELGEERLLAEGLAAADDVRFSPDGRWFLYEALDGGRSTLWLVQVVSGQQERLVEGAVDFRVGWSADSRSLLVGWQGEHGWSLSLVRLADRQSRRVSRGADFAVADFSPRGRWYTVWERRGNQWSLLLGRTDGEQPSRVLAERADGIGLVSWSPYGSRLAYGFFQDGQWRLALTTPARDDSEALAPGDDYAWVVFRPKGDGFVLWRWREQIGALTLVGKGREHRLLASSAETWARWSADGRWLAASDWNGRTWKLWLWAVPDAGAPDAPLLLVEGADDVDALFSEDGQRLLYRQWRDGRWWLTVRDLASGEAHTLLAAKAEAQGSWAPDGEHVLLWWRRPPEEGVSSPGGTLGVAEAGSGRRVALLDGLRTVQGGFSRDGSKLALATESVTGATRTWVADPDGSRLLELDRQSYRIYWATAPFLFGPRPPAPGGER